MDTISKSKTDELEHGHLPEILLDLANYNYDKLIQHSLLLLDRHYTAQTDILQKAIHTQLLKTPESNELYRTVNGLLLNLIAFLSSGSETGMDGDVPSPLSVLTKYCWLEDEVAVFETHQINQSIILSFGMIFQQCHVKTSSNYHNTKNYRTGNFKIVTGKLI